MANLAGPVTLESHTYVETSFRCHDYASSTPTTTITAGGTLDLLNPNFELEPRTLTSNPNPDL